MLVRMPPTRSSNGVRSCGQSMDFMRTILQNSEHQTPRPTDQQCSPADVVFVIDGVEVTYNELRQLAAMRTARASGLTGTSKPPRPRSAKSNSPRTYDSHNGLIDRPSGCNDKVDRHSQERLDQKYHELQMLLNDQSTQSNNYKQSHRIKHGPIGDGKGSQQKAKRQQVVAGGPYNVMEASLKQANETWSKMPQSPHSVNDNDNNASDDLNSSMNSTKRVSFVEGDGSAETTSVSSTDSSLTLTDEDLTPKSILKAKVVEANKDPIKKGHRKFSISKEHYPSTNVKKPTSSKKAGKDSLLEKLCCDDVQQHAMIHNSRTFEPTDNHLETTDNEKILSWISDKKLLQRRARKEQKFKLAEKRETARTEADYRMQRLMENEKAVDEWMQAKRKRLLAQQRQEMERRKKDRKKTELLKKESASADGSKPSGDDNNTEKHDHTKAVPSEKTKDTQSDTNTENVKVTVETEKKEKEIKRQAKLSAKLNARHRNVDKRNDRKRPQSARPTVSPAKMTANRPRSARGTKDTSSSPDSAEADKIRKSYDQWLAEKKKEIASEKLKVKEKEEKNLASRSDPELEKIIPDLAKRRIDRIRTNKTRIDTGLQDVDAATNSAFGGDSAKEEGNVEKPKQQPYTWALPPKDFKKMSGPSPHPPSTANPHSTRRPQSARPSFGRPVPPRPSKSPTPQPQRLSHADRVSSSQYNPFHTNLPPEIARLSDNAKNKGAASRRSYYAQQTWHNVNMAAGERPEPQGCDQTDSTCRSSPRQQGHTSSSPGDIQSSVKKTLDASSNETKAKEKKSPNISSVSSSIEEDLIASDMSMSHNQSKCKTFLTSVE